MEHERNGVKEATLPLDPSDRPSGHDDNYPSTAACFRPQPPESGWDSYAFCVSIPHFSAAAMWCPSACSGTTAVR